MAKSSKTVLILACSVAITFFVWALFPYMGYSKGGQIRKIALKRIEGGSLPIPLFAELLSLSSDRPPDYNCFDVKKAEQALSSLGVFKNVSLKKCKPDLLLVDYELQKPLYVLGDQSNMLVSEGCTLMPSTPYFTPKKLPLLYLGSKKIEDYADYLKTIIGLVREGEVEMIDLRGVGAASKAQRELVMRVRQEHALHLLRLDPLYIEKQLKYYFILQPFLTENTHFDLTIDLRFPESAYLQVGI